MNIAELIAEHLLDVYAGQNWTEVNLQFTLADISYEEASQLTPTSANTIAADATATHTFGLSNCI